MNPANGCICRALVDVFATSLSRTSKLASSPDPIVVEASGVDGPFRLRMRGKMPGFRRDGEAFRALASRVPAGVIRARGVLCLREAPGPRTILPLVGKRWSLKPGGRWEDLHPGTRRVMIGLPGGLGAGWLEENLASTEVNKE